MRFARYSIVLRGSTPHTHRRLAAEIDAIRAGEWDDRIRAELAGDPWPPETQPRPTTPELSLPAPDVTAEEGRPVAAPSPTTTSTDAQADSSQIVEQMLAGSVRSPYRFTVLLCRSR